MLVGENIIQDKSSDSLMIYSLIENITSVSFPYFFQNFELLVTLDKEDLDEDTQSCVIRVFNNDYEVISYNANVSFFGQNYTRVFYTINGIAASQPGNLRIEFHLGEQKLNSYFIKLEQIDLSL